RKRWPAIGVARGLGVSSSRASNTSDSEASLGGATAGIGRGGVGTGRGIGPLFDVVIVAGTPGSAARAGAGGAIGRPRALCAISAMQVQMIGVGTCSHRFGT